MSRVFFMHVHGTGKAEDLARRVRPGLDLIGHVTPAAPAKSGGSTGTALDTAKLAQIVGHEGASPLLGPRTCELASGFKAALDELRKGAPPHGTGN